MNLRSISLFSSILFLVSRRSSIIQTTVGLSVFVGVCVCEGMAASQMVVVAAVVVVVVVVAVEMKMHS